MRLLRFPDGLGFGQLVGAIQWMPTVLALVVIFGAATPVSLAAEPAHPAAAAKAGNDAADLELQSLAEKLGSQLNNLSASYNRGPAQDVEARVVVTNVKAEPIGGDAPGAKLKIFLRVSEMQLQGGEFVDSDFDVDVDLRRVGDLWTCTRAMATRGMVSTKFGPVAGREPEEPYNVTGAVQGALVKIGAAEPASVVLREAIVKWVSENNSLDAGSPIGDDMGKLAEKYLTAGKNIGILLGPGLMKSGKGTRIGVFCRQLYVVQYTDAQTKQVGLTSNNVVEITDATTGLRRIPPDAEIGKPDFAAAGLDLGSGVRGTLKVRATRRLPKADYVIRLSYNTGSQSISAYCHFDEWLGEKEKPVEFKFGPAGPETAKFSGPLVVFMDVCEMYPDGQGAQSVEVISATKVMVIDVKPGNGKR